jgi:alkyldihydroxyacetonephosphate synthase
VETLLTLQERLPEGAVRSDPDELRSRSHDWWALALLREARGDQPTLPAAVVVPTSTEDVAAVLAWAQTTRTPVVPRGAGSGVSGGAEPVAGCVVLDLSELDRVLEVDEVSQVVHVQAGMRGDRLEARLETHGLTAGHYPQSIAISSVGGWIAASGAGQASAGYGAIEERLVGLSMVLPGGRVLRVPPTPRSAAGPDLRRLLIGWEGTLGVITEAYLQCDRRPAGFEWEAFRFAAFERCMDAFRHIVRSHAGAAVMRAYDPTDATLNFGRVGHGEGCVAIVGFPAELPGLDDRRRAAVDLAAAAGGEPLGPAFGEHWWAHRNDAVDTYRRIMGPDRMFGPGVVVDTMEVAGLWRGLPRLYDAVRAALGEHAEAVGCHLSHVYASGSSLYFTFLVRATDDREVEPAYLATWDAALKACLAQGGTITHHHGVGRLKAAYLAGELGEEGVALLRKIKDAVDPFGLMNPGTLFA